MYLYVDAETYSDLDLSKVGAHSYAEHESTEVILWSVFGGKLGRPLVFEHTVLEDLIDRMRDERVLSNEPVTLVHWGPFDELILRKFESCDYEFLDLQQVCLTYGGPMPLDQAAKFFGGGELKSKGKALIDLFCTPERVMPQDAPVKWEEFRSYAAQDTAVLKPIHETFMWIEESGGHSMKEHAPAIALVQRMNAKGVPTDQAAVRSAIEQLEATHESAIEESVEICGIRPTQLQKLKGYLGLPNMQAQTVEQYLLREQLPEDHRRVAEIQQQTSGAAWKKLYALREMGPRVRGCFVYHGAWTRRWTSMDAQFHNFVRSPYKDQYFIDLAAGIIPPELIFKETRSNIRGFVMTPRHFVAADFSAVECRFTNWLSDELWVLDLFREGRDPYRHLASQVFSILAEAVDDAQRQVGKIGELALGFQGGAKAVMHSGLSYGMDISKSFAEQMKEAYRASHPNVVKTWAKCDRAMRHCIAGGEPMRVNGKFIFSGHPWGVKVTRPSGMAQYFFNARIEPGTWQDGSPKEGGEITFDGRGKGGVMWPLRTYGGDIFQGIVQGCAADLMCDVMIQAETAGFDPCLQIHDEGVFEVDDPKRLGELTAMMSVPPWWAPDIPIKSEGWDGLRFTKC